MHDIESRLFYQAEQIADDRRQRTTYRLLLDAATALSDRDALIEALHHVATQGPVAIEDMLDEDTRALYHAHFGVGDEEERGRDRYAEAHALLSDDDPEAQDEDEPRYEMEFEGLS